MKKISKATRNVAINEPTLVIIDGSEAHLISYRQFVAGRKAADPQSGIHKRCGSQYWGNHTQDDCHPEYNKRVRLGFSWSRDVQEEATEICRFWGYRPSEVCNIWMGNSQDFDLETALSLSAYVPIEKKSSVRAIRINVSYWVAYKNHEVYQNRKETVIYQKEITVSSKKIADRLRKAADQAAISITKRLLPSLKEKNPVAIAAGDKYGKTLFLWERAEK